MSRPDLSAVSTDALLSELYRRSGEVALLSITPQDLAEYWECDDSGSTHPDSRMPDADAWAMARRAFDRWQDKGNASDAYEAMRDAWNESDRRKKGGDR